MNAHHAHALRTRDPDATRQTILMAAFEEIHAQGFRNASLDAILARTGVTKGALYHHFPNKKALGLAVIDEVLWPVAQQQFAALADPAITPVDALCSFIREELAQKEYLCERTTYGCPINNLVQEMSTVDEEFRERLVRIQDAWRTAIREALARGQRQGTVRQDLDPERIAAVLVASYEGCNGVAKAAQDNGVYATCMQGLIDLGETLRAK